MIVDINTARPDIQNYGIDATYTLIDLATGKPLSPARPSRACPTIFPVKQQRFAGERGLRDAEDRAAKVIAEKIRNAPGVVFRGGT